MTIYLDIIGNKNDKYIYAKQNDYGRKIKIVFTKDGRILDVSDMKIFFKMPTSNGTAIEKRLSNNKKYVSLVLSKDITQYTGLLPYQLIINGANEEVISTITSYINCEGVEM